MSQARSVWLTAFLLSEGPAALRAEVLPGPVCSRPEVLDVVATDIARNGVASTIVPGGVGEIPTVLPGAVRCAVRVSTRFFDTNRFGLVPQYRVSVLEFTVRSGRNGLFVDAIGSLP